MIKILNSENVTKEEILCRVQAPDNVAPAVDAVLANVKENGDKAIIEYAKLFDKADIDCVEVSQEEMDIIAQHQK